MKSLVLSATIHGQVDHLAIGSTFQFLSPPSPQYAVGNVTDGVTGIQYFGDKAWLGFDNVNLEVVIDLKAAFLVEFIGAHFLQAPQAEIFLPDSVTFQISTDGQTYCVVDMQKTNWWEQEIYDIRTELYSYLPTSPVSARYIKVQALNLVPSWYEKLSGKAWLFIDEVIVNPNLN